jgi:hypothetical protein
VAPGIASAIAFDIATGVPTSFSPAMTSVGALMRCRSPLKSRSRIALQHAM